jgi:hypothetical protein
MNKTLTAEVERLPAERPAQDSMMVLIERMATDPQVNPEKLMQLIDVKERWEANEARKAFVEALAAFKSDPPKLLKDRQVSFDTGRGKTEYAHADLGKACQVIGASLGAYGLSHRWETEQLEGGVIRVTCVLTHKFGHSERVSLQAGADQSGGKNNIQAIGSTVTYLERYTLLAATGIAAEGQDDDGARGGAAPMISEDQILTLNTLIKDTGADQKTFFAFFKIPDLYHMPAARYDQAVRMLESKKK